MTASELVEPGPHWGDLLRASPELRAARLSGRWLELQAGRPEAVRSAASRWEARRPVRRRQSGAEVSLMGPFKGE